jgi:uncharacterized membrane protein YgcG
MRQSFLTQVCVATHTQRWQPRHRPTANVLRVYVCVCVCVCVYVGVSVYGRAPSLSRDRANPIAGSSIVSYVCVVCEFVRVHRTCKHDKWDLVGGDGGVCCGSCGGGGGGGGGDSGTGSKSEPSSNSLSSWSLPD